jgi:hypothetical protein
MMSLKLGFTVWNEWYTFPSKTMDVQHPVISEEIGGSLRSVPWLLLSVTASRISSSRRFLRRDHQLGIPCWETLLDRCGMFLSCLLRRKHLMDAVSQKHISCDLCTSFACYKVKKTIASQRGSVVLSCQLHRMSIRISILLCFDFQVHLQSILFVIFGHSTASYMRQHFNYPQPCIKWQRDP